MGWLFMLVAALAAALFFGVKPQIGFYISFALLSLNFATFCLLYDEPMNRARQRVTQRLAQLSSKGIHAEEYQRLQSMKIVPTREDQKFRLTALSIVNVATGAAGVLMLAWAAFARFS